MTGERGEEEILENETVCAKVLSGKEFSGRNGRKQMWLEHQQGWSSHPQVLGNFHRSSEKCRI